MKFLDLTLETPEKNLACDEALLDSAESGGDEVLRFWEPKNHFVVLGYSNKINSEVNVKTCASRGVPILRRPSGGGTVLQGPGCLNYSLILRIDSRPELQSLTQTNTYVMEKNRQAISTLEKNIRVRGITDLTLNDLKFSGNAQRRKRFFLLFHGTFLMNFDRELMEEVLPMPSKQPCYRGDRRHIDFLTCLPYKADAIKQAMCGAWAVSEPLSEVPFERIEHLDKEHYSSKEWVNKF